MNEQNMNMSEAQPMTPGPKGSMGATISIIVIVLVLILGALYFFKQVPIDTTAPLTPAQVSADQTVSSLATQGASTDITDIQKDLNNTNLSNVGAGVSNISI